MSLVLRAPFWCVGDYELVAMRFCGNAFWQGASGAATVYCVLPVVDVCYNGVDGVARMVNGKAVAWAECCLRTHAGRAGFFRISDMKWPKAVWELGTNP
jgi:hypothetical protein